MAIQRLDATPSYHEFRKFLISNTPVILPPSATSTWACFRTWFKTGSDGRTVLNFQHLDWLYGHEPVIVVDCSSWDYREDTFGSVLNSWKHGKDQQCYVKDWHLPLRIHAQSRSVKDELYDVSELWLDDYMNSFYCAETSDDFRFLYLGGSKTFTPVHRDVYWSYSISTNILGTKRWILFPPSCTELLAPLLKDCERQDAPLDVRNWDQDTVDRFAGLGMIDFVQGERETIFVPSGWYHQVINSPGSDNNSLCFSLNHNWCNAHNLPAMYRAMCAEIEVVRESISDVKDMLRNNGTGWETEWEECVGELLRKSAGWNWTTFWEMIEFSLVERSNQRPSAWPRMSTSSQPPKSYVTQQVEPLLGDFSTRPEATLVPGLASVLDRIKDNLKRI
ncbi:Clavaminate synthase-like protein, partial [Meredithblackwellia eburnea MCA 4105]